MTGSRMPLIIRNDLATTAGARQLPLLADHTTTARRLCFLQHHEASRLTDANRDPIPDQPFEPGGFAMTI